ncbi:hypothetical protein [Streptomyces sp. NPDC000410]|uniref:hypothetical protein n=1 Tax=Streptomyces sp. NPDC000410 TaxID=3154254 RepID=UPI003320E730
MLIHTVAWIVIAVTVPWEDPFAETMWTGLFLLAFTGVPSMLLAISVGLAHTRMDVTQYRALMTPPMLVFAFPARGFSTMEPVLLQLMAQLAFPWLMPAPLVPENWKQEPA